MKAYWYDNLPGDQREAHDSGKEVTADELKKLGVYYHHITTLDDVDVLASDGGYKNRDEIIVSPATMGAMYEEKVRSFFHEHLHEDEEIRYIRDGRERFQRIDVVANCSGYGVIGACEDQDEHEIRDQFETNFMGTLNIIQASLPYFRQQNGGRYLIFSSTSGALGVPGLGPYCATKDTEIFI
ncbi:1,2-dihydroxy-3-keto-5-methylthiopentene dioxygenase [Colletotrichum trifolii]|uniref:1,2-dihydroxy-3-keto-5-methylthiopentene dioxygenase n=1 Tax=Colletotrichum trifolii TaxID=5466 RepID=A0A4R8PW24_COLTR|nr:1,2-dihydroxy-3-keto-5-methylthiopentene dioxygenase [Colletotrichum trifolii]